MSHFSRNIILTAFFCFILVFFLVFPGQAKKKTGVREVIQKTDPVLRLQWFKQHKEMKASSPYKNLAWSHIGPINVSGRCTDIAVVTPKGKNYTVYVATASGGV